MLKAQLRKNFHRLTENALIDEISESGIVKEFSQGEVALTAGEYITYAPLIISGTFKVSRQNETGDEVFLYYLQEGDTCADTLQCCFTNQKSQVNVIAEEASVAVLVDIRKVNMWASKYKSWKEFIMLSFKAHFNQLLETIDAIAFKKIDERLIAYLKEKQEILQSKELSLTHQDIAYDLNTSREVVSRLLKNLEKNGIVKLGRNRIQIL